MEDRALAEMTIQELMEWCEKRCEAGRCIDCDAPIMVMKAIQAFRRIGWRTCVLHGWKEG